ncbi:hypothetical protein BJX68DRAFT_274230 [Aspergillus pseudodeflectus]|uniref:NAD(P)-binding protein n=1 Tax=Aspergillus pseudodeflectus TaxID=176178 RepID=A0ABR4JB86_9EURO
MIPKVNAFTKKLHRDVYRAVDPRRPDHSQAGKVVVITGASRALGAIAPLGRSANDLAETEELIRKINPVTQVHSIAVNEVNTKGTLTATQAFLHKVGSTPSRPTTIINASIGGIPRLSSYNMSKMANTKLTQYVQVEHPTVTSVCIDPGVVETSWTDIQALQFLLPLERDMFELVGAVGTWVASRDISFLSGRYLSINWDVEELEARREEVLQKDLLTLCHRESLQNRTYSTSELTPNMTEKVATQLEGEYRHGGPS